MNKTEKYQKYDIKDKKKIFIEEENLTFKDIKREKYQKQYRNYENALRSKNLDRLISYDEDQ